MDGHDIKKVLDTFPSNVRIYEIVAKQSKVFIQSVVEKRRCEEDTGTFDNNIEKLKGYNVLSFLYFVQDEREHAIRYSDLALGVDGENINALASRTFYHLRWLELNVSREYCNRLKTLKENVLENISAQAEVAYLFSKFGMEFYPEAEKRFEEVLQESKHYEVPAIYLCSWNLSLAQTIRRQLNIHNALILFEPEKTKTMNIRVISLLINIINKEVQFIERYKARAYTELGFVLLSDTNLRAAFTHEECMMNALELGFEDDFVLERCGRYYKLTNNLQRAIKCFERALTKNETSYCHHHLALCYKNKILTDRAGRVDRNATASSHKDSSSRNWRNQPRASVRWSRTAVYNRNGQRPMSQEEICLAKTVKCPEELRFIPHTETNIIIEHLEKAFVISHGKNVGARYDKGLIHRSSKQLEQAIDTFKLLIQNPNCTDLQLCNSYEQAALCMLEIAHAVPSSKEILEFDAKEYLMKAMQLSLTMIRKIPNLKRCWHSRPTLKMLLLRQAHSKGKLREFVRFYQLLEKHKYVIGFLEQVLSVEEDEEEKQKIQIEVIKANLKTKNYNKAILMLSMILCLPNGEKDIEKGLLVDVCIKAGFDAYKRGETELAKRHVKTALRYSSPHVSTYIDNAFDNIFDCFILSTESSDETARKFCKVLTDLGVNNTLNSDNVTPGFPERENIMDRIDVSQTVIVYIGVNDDSADLDYLRTYTDMIRKRFMVISEGGRAERDSLYKRYQLVALNCEMMDDNGNITSEYLQWMEDFFLCLLSE